MALSDIAGGINNALKQQMLQRLQAEAVQRQVEQQKFANQMAEKQFASNEELKRANLAELVSSHDAAEQDRQNNYALKLGDEVPKGTQVPNNAPSAGPLNRAGLLSMNGIKAEAPPSSLLAMGDSGQPQEVAGTMPNSPMPNGPRLYTKLASAKQLDTEADNTRQAAKDAQGRAHELAMEKIAQQNANKPGPMSTVTIQTVDAEGRPVTRVIPKSEAVGQEFKKAAGSTMEGRLASAKAVAQTGNDIIAQLSDPAFIAAVGPALGRANTIREFIGNPPPEFAQLAGQIESYALANMGVHGMRSAQGAEQIKHLLDQKHTPASLISTINGLNSFSEHFLQNAGHDTGKTPTPAAGGAVSMVAPDGRALSVPADKVAEMEAHGAKRR